MTVPPAPHDLDKLEALLRQFEIRVKQGESHGWRTTTIRIDQLAALVAAARQADKLREALREISETRLDESLSPERGCSQARIAMQTIAREALAASPAAEDDR